MSNRVKITPVSQFKLFIVTDPGFCPEEKVVTVYGMYIWPSMPAQSQYDMGCERGTESATRFW